MSRDTATEQGASIPVLLRCPECDATGWIEWKSLKHGIKCPKCECQFLIGPSGRVLSQSELPHTRYTCPRCRQSGSIPTVLCGRGALCPGCRLPLALGPDQRLHDTKAVEAMRRSATAVPRSHPIAEALQSALVTDDGRLRIGYFVGGAGALAVIVAVLVIVVLRMFDNSPATIARRFTYACLADKRVAAQKFLEDDTVQRIEFDRWWTMFYPSIADKQRPSGDSAAATVEPLQVSPDACALRVTISSRHIGTRAQNQRWYQRDGRWYFDALGTLAEIDQRRLPPRGGAASPHIPKSVSARPDGSGTTHAAAYTRR